MEATRAADGETLPEPTSGIFLEVSFRRLLASCEAIVDGTSTARPDLVGSWQRSPVFHHYVETLQEQLADLEASAGGRLPRSLLDRYAAHVDALATRLQQPDLPAYCAAPPAPAAMLHSLQQQAAPAAARNGSNGGSTAAAAADAQPLAPAAGAAAPPVRPAVVPPPVPVARIPQFKPAARPDTTAGVPPAAGGSAVQARRGQPPAGAQSDRLHTQQQLHEDLTEELAGLAAKLKSNTLAIEGRLKEREQLLDTTEGALDKSLRHTRESKERATQVHRRGRANFCLTCLVMLIVGLTFAAMYVFIKVTRFAGYRAAVPAAAAVLPTGPDPAAAPGELGGVPLEFEQHYDL